MDSGNRVDTGAGFNGIRNWAPVGFIGLLMLTGFEIHGAFSVFGFELAHNIHLRLLVLAPIIIIGFIITNKHKEVFLGRSYLRVFRKPLWRRIYLLVGLTTIILQTSSGALYFCYNYWSSSNFFMSLRDVAYIHTVGAFVITGYMIIHIYLAYFYPRLNQRKST